MPESKGVPDEIARIAERSDAQAWADFCLAAPPEVAKTCGTALHRAGGAIAGLATHVDVLALNRIVNLGMDEPASERVLDQLIAPFDAAQVPRFFVQLGPNAKPAALADWLGARELQPYNNWVKFFRGVEPPPQVATDLRIEEIGTAYASDFARLVQGSFGFPEAVLPWLSAIVGRDYWRHYMAFAAGIPVATACLYTRGSYSWLGFAATLGEYRNRGAQNALIARRIRDSISSGSSFIIAETAEQTPDRPSPSFQNMRRMGFNVAYLRPNYLYKRSQIQPDLSAQSVAA